MVCVGLVILLVLGFEAVVCALMSFQYLADNDDGYYFLKHFDMGTLLTYNLIMAIFFSIVGLFRLQKLRLSSEFLRHREMVLVSSLSCVPGVQNGGLLSVGCLECSSYSHPRSVLRSESHHVLDIPHL